MTALRRKTPLKPEAALIKLEELCARSEQCEGEIRRKLSTWGISPSDSDTIVRSLQRRRFVDDSRFAAAFVRDKYRFARWGRRKIEMALRQKRVDRDIIDEALDNIDEDEYIGILQHLLAAKAKTLQLGEYADRQRLFRFGVTRGFEPQLVAKAIKAMISSADE